METAVINQEAGQLTAEAMGLALQFAKYSVLTHEEYIEANNLLSGVKRKIKRLEDLRKSLTAPLDKSKSNIMDLFRPPTDALMGARDRIDAEMQMWRRKQETIRLEQERKAQAAARAEEEKQRLALLKKAEKAEVKGNAEKAEELKEQAATVFIPPPVIASSIPKLEGMSVRVDWDFEVTDVAAIPREFLVADLVKIRGVVRAMKGTSSIPGIRVFSKEIISNSRRG